MLWFFNSRRMLYVLPTLYVCTIYLRGYFRCEFRCSVRCCARRQRHCRCNRKMSTLSVMYPEMSWTAKFNWNKCFILPFFVTFLFAIIVCMPSSLVVVYEFQEWCRCLCVKNIKLNPTRKLIFAVGGWFSAWHWDNKNKRTQAHYPKSERPNIKTTTSIYFFSIIFSGITLHYRFGLNRKLAVEEKLLVAAETAKSVAIFPRRMFVNFAHS